MEETMTFNDLPMVLQQVLNKIERLEQVLDGIKEEMTVNNSVKVYQIRIPNVTVLLLSSMKDCLAYITDSKLYNLV